MKPEMFLNFTHIEREKESTYKTRLWAVNSTVSGDQLGRIGWHNPWRKYVFIPNSFTIFDDKCMREVAEFCSRETRMHKFPLLEVTCGK